MATKKISELLEITEADDSDVLVIVDVSEEDTNKITKGNLLIGAAHSIEMSLNPTTYQLTLTLKNAAGDVLGTAQTIDLPNENAIIGITYSNGKLTLTKQSGSTSTVDISPLIEGLVTESDFNTFTAQLQQTLQGINETIGAINVKNLAQDEEIEENYKEITKLKSKVAEQEEIINQMPQAEDEGYDATLNDTIKAPFRKFDIEGHSEQETTEGKNLLNYIDNLITSTAGLRSVINEDGSITTTGVPSYNSPQLISINITSILTNGQNYTFSQKTSQGNKLYLLLRIYNKTTQENTYLNLIEAKSRTFTANTDNYNYYLALQTGTTSQWGSTSLTITNYYQLEQGSTATDFEKYTYGASPNPSYEQPIKSCGDNVQLLNINATSQTLNGVEFTVYSNGTIKANGTATAGFDFNIASAFTLPAGTYTLSDGVNASSSTYFTYIDGPSMNTSLRNPYTYTSESNINITKARIVIRNGAVLNNVIFKIKLEKGTTATPWSPYGMGSITEKIVNKNWLDKVNINWYRNNSADFDNKANGLTDRIRTNPFRILGGKTYTISGLPSGITFNNIRTYDIKKDYLGSATKSGNSFTLNSNVAYIHVLCNGTGMTDATNTLMKNADIQIELGSTTSSYIAHEEQTYTIPTQQPMRSIGTVRDKFVKVNGTWYERHMPYIESYNGETLPQDVYNEIDGVKYCNEKSMSTTGQFSTGASVQYVDENNWNDLPCTQAQIDILENLPRTYKTETNVNSEDEIEAYLKVAGLKDLNKMFSDITNAIISLGGNV